MAPESLNSGRNYSTQTDVWSYGVVIWEMFSSGTLPFHTLSNREVIEEVCNCRTLEVPDNVDERTSNLMRQCWQSNDKHRPSFTNIREAICQMQLETGI